MNRYSALILAFSFVAGCSGDDDSGGAACMAGATQQCTCSDGTTTGTQLCDANGVLGACLPCMPAGGAGGAGGMGGMGGTSGNGGVGGVGGSGGLGGTGGMGGLGGMGGMMSMDDDAGMDDDGGVDDGDAGIDAGADAGNTGEQGAQNGACRASGTACDDGLGCYEPDNALPSFCTAECTEDADCDALSGADWTCWVNGGLCRVVCDSTNGNDDCPTGFECVEVVGSERCIPIE